MYVITNNKSNTVDKDGLHRRGLPGTRYRLQPPIAACLAAREQGALCSLTLIVLTDLRLLAASETMTAAG